MTTVRELITGAMRLVNIVQVGEAPTADDMEISRKAFVGMVDSWSTENLNIFTKNPYYFPLVPGKQSYTLGTGGDFDTPRPMNIERATISYGAMVQGNTVTLNDRTVDIPIEQLNDAQWSAIGVKAISSTFPTKYWDNGNYPLRTISFWPIPRTNTPVTLWLWQPLIDPDTLDQEVAFPKGYERAFRFALAVEIAAEFGKDPSNTVVQIASKAMGKIRRLNHNTQVMNGSIELVQGNTVFNWILGVSQPASPVY